MSTWLIVWFVVGLVTTAALVVFLVALGRHALILGRTVSRMQEEVGELAGDIAREGSRAAERAQGLHIVRGTGRS